MAKVYLPLDLYLTQQKNPPLIPVVQGDVDSRFVIVKFWNRNDQILVIEGETVRLVAQKPDGIITESIGVVNSDGSATIELHSYMIQDVGNVKCTVQILGTSDEVLSSFVFFVRVVQSIGVEPILPTVTPGDMLEGVKAFGAEGLVTGTIETYDGSYIADQDGMTLNTANKYLTQNIEVETGAAAGAEALQAFRAYPSGEGQYVITARMLQGAPRIKDFAFQNSTNLKSVVLPDTVTRTGYYTFYNTGITYLETGTGMENIGERTATGCRYLVKAVLRGNNAIVGPYCFQNDAALEDVVLEEGIAQIQNFAFAGCVRLKPIVIPESCVKILQSAFQVDANLPSYLNREFYVLFKRRPKWNQAHTTLTAYPTLLGSNILNNRPRDNLVAFVPWDCFLVYSTINLNGMNNANAGIWDDCGGWIEAQEGQTLPTTNTETYSGTTKTYSYSWYKEPSMTTPVTVADEDGTYYAYITEVQ